MSTPLDIRANYYQQFDRDFTRDVPAEGYGGWKQTQLRLAPEHTAVVVMHAWDCGTRDEFPGWHRCVEYMDRADPIVRDVSPPILAATRSSPLKVYHMLWGSWRREMFEHLPGYQRAKRLAPPPTATPRIHV